tara:strand:- start:7269 stop:7532 length:264 start_codon:yes stop_codon:yes gene_type:complete
MTFTTQDIVNSLADDGMAISAIAQLWREDKFQKQHELRGNQLAHIAVCTNAGFNALNPAEIEEAREIAMDHADQLAGILAQHLEGVA